VAGRAASILPLLLTFVGALPAAISGVVALGGAALAAAGALAAVAGIGLLGLATTPSGDLSLSTLQRRITEVANTFLDAFAPIAQHFVPLAEDGFDGLQNIARDLAVRLDTLFAVTDDARAFITYLEQSVGPTLERIAEFGIAALPIFEAIEGGLADMGLVRSFASVLADTLPSLALLSSMLVQLLGPLFRVSQGFLRVAVVLGFAFTIITRVLGAVPFLAETLGVLAGALLVATTATQLMNLATTGLITQFGRLVYVGLARVEAFFASYISSTTAATLATLAFAAAAVTLLGILSAGIVPALGLTSGGFSGLSGDIDDATESLRQFDQQSAVGAPTFGAAPTAGRGRRGYPSATTIVAPDRETGMAVAHSQRLHGEEARGDATNCANRLHDCS